VANALVSFSSAPTTNQNQTGGNKTKKKRPAKPNKRKTTKGGGYVIKAEYERWPRQSTFDKPTKDIDAFEMTSFTNEFEEAIKLNFGKRQASNQDKLDQQRFLHSFALGGLNQRNQSPHQIKGDTQNLTRYCFEDLIQCCPVSDGTDTVNMPFLLALPTATSNANLSKQLDTICKQQKKNAGLGGTKRFFRGKEYYMLTGTMLENDDHLAIKKSTMSLEQLKTKFADGSGRFDILFDGTNVQIPFSWRNIINNPMAAMFFSAPVTTNRFYNDLFDTNRLTSMSHCFQIFKTFALELWGDSLLCNKLLNAFQAHQAKLLKISNDKLKQTAENPCNLVTFVGDKKFTEFFKKINKLFEDEMFQCNRIFQDYSTPIVTFEQLQPFLENSKELFPVLWSLLSGLRGIKPNRKRSAHLVEAKEWQVFFQVLMLARMADRDRLVDWSLVQTIANNTRSVSQAAGCNSTYWGITVSPSTALRKRKIRQANLVQCHIDLLKPIECCIGCMDNCQMGQQKANQSGGSSSDFVQGTSQMTVLATPFTDTAFDSMYVERTYDLEQQIIAPIGMPALEHALDFDNFHASLLGYKNLVPERKPDSTFRRVEAYNRAIKIIQCLKHTQRVFATKDVSIAENQFDSDNIAAMFECVKDKRAKELFKCANEFQAFIVKTWKPNYGQVTQQNFLGIAALTEDSKKPCFALALDFLLKFGLIVDTTGNGDWDYAPGWEKKRAIIVGDAKTAENIVAWLKSVEKRELSFSQSSYLAEMFIDVLSQVMIMPGDWHAGLAMLQSIVTLFWDGIIGPIAIDLLCWKRIGPDTRKCYFTTCRVVIYIANEMVRMFQYEMVSARPKYDKANDDSAEFTCKFTIEFMSYLEEIAEGEDEWRRACALFVLMVFDFQKFVEGYRGEDAIIVEVGYRDFAPIWLELNQKKYFERFCHQVDTLYADFPLSRLQELRINRFVRRYAAELGKQAVAMDEEIELWHCDLSFHGMPKSLDGLIAIGADLGLGRRCKQFTDRFFSISGIKEAVVNRRGVEQSMIPEMMLIWEALTKTETEKEKMDRQFTVQLLLSIKHKLTTKLTRGKKKKALTEVESSFTYIQLFSSVNQIDDECLGSSSSAAASSSTNNASDSDANVSNNNEETNDEEANAEAAAEIDDTLASNDVLNDKDWVCPDNVSKRKIHDKALTAVKKTGNEAIKKMNIQRERQNAKDRTTRKRRVRKELYELYKSNEQQGKSTKIGMETPHLPMPLWRRQAREMRKDGRFKSNNMLS